MTTRRQFLQCASSAGILLGLSSGGAMAQTAPMSKQVRQGMTPGQALTLLKEGNDRFVGGKMLERDLMAQVRATAAGQYPFAGVLGCIDSRVPPELVFDQGIGDIFSARIAGNFVNTDFIGSFEFVTKLAGAKLIIVLGHTECGAIKGACDNAQLGILTSTLSNIMPAVYGVTGVPGERNSSNPAFVTEVARENVRLNVKALTLRSVVLHNLVERGEIKIVGAMHDVSTGRVSLLA
jgi:carbonic anhydrase